MVKQYTFCPRLFHLMYVEGRWDDNTYTIEGRHIHRRVDQLDHLLPEADLTSSDVESPQNQSPQGDDPPTISRSVPLASAELGLSAKLDLVSSDGAEAIPVETKRGRVPNNPQRSHDSHRVQLMAQGLLLREHGYTCDHGVIYFAGSRTRVDVPFTPDLEQQTRDLIEQTHHAATRQTIPDPLDDSPKCNGCSLAGICLPDETLALRQLGDELVAPPIKPRHGTGDEDQAMVRRLYPVRPDATPLYVQTQGAYIGKRGQSLIVRAEGAEVAKASLKDVSQLVLCGNVQVSTQTIHLLCESDIPVVLLSSGWWFYGITHGQSLRNAYDRAAQFHAAADPQKCLSFAKTLVRDKALNQRTQLRRNAPPSADLDLVLNDIDSLIGRIMEAPSIEVLLGLEGNAARCYFSSFAQMLKPRDFDSTWDFESRNRRPPRDPVNAMLSFAYALLAKECTVALLSEGLDPYWGFYHRPRHGRPALALDLMEPFRAVIADSAVISAINTGMVRAAHFTQAASGCAMNDIGRKGLLRAYEARLDQLVTHPIFDYRCAWRSVIRLQARLLSRWLRGDVPEYTSVTTR
ncbi:MAG: CRISPR-associated endonuclease Cas1 [Phycisphaerales bacterium]|nr:CRISPR-associated endonuclease Cas1 [Phycisphaerales bacterium]